MTSLFTNFKSPGVRIQETTQGYRALEIASFETHYIIGSSATGAYLYPTQVSSLEDFTNQFGASPSEASIRLLFRNDKRAIVFFIRTPIAVRRTVTVSTAAAGTYTVTIAGTAVNYVATGTPTKADIASGLIAAVNSSTVASLVTAGAGLTTDALIIRCDDPIAAIPTLTVGTNLALTVTTPTTPAAIDYVYAVENSFDSEDAYTQGFIYAPEAFQLLSLQSDRQAVGLALEAQASDEAFDWIALIDPGVGLTPAQAQTEALLYNSPQGHSAFFYPYLTDLESTVVPPSAAVAGLHTRRFREEGLQQPGAGAKFPVLGVLDVVTKVNTQQQEILNPIGVNVIRNLRNKGIVVWGMRTRSTSEFYTFLPTRVIMNVLNGTLRSGFDNDLFTSIDGFGLLLNAISQTAFSVCNRLWRGRLLFGATEAAAFEVICNFTNNTQEELERGNVILEVYAVSAPALEKLLVSTVRVSIGTLPLNQSQTVATQLPAA
ncbi:MAG: phage tail sheath subtilisin-like domain-containing protein [Nostoc sp. DedVER02]|uniref:phage tail sheath subtilisin-like domain-containing protein n=1 Tax=unclassified Nostoc TaxID=2593658 RepID=UPI002AD1E2E0|nr:MULTISPECIES: phage tail sheath subtilisin-like domain-containing protein [unclassified Nostoc]MDZ7987122.1 phage tail sheath subtilisin-like domain-containing protein [Nostoc sp. DedVER02]MDZ8111008.1 phage tail sheath subtilisin-like domain-containing protein [Nostoc sp. DedVER01b]